VAASITKRIALALTLSLCFGAAAAQSNPVDDRSVPDYLLGGPSTTLELFVDQTKSLDIISPNGVNYDSGEGDIIFDVLGPFFCFELSDEITDRALLLSLNDANGDAILEGFRPEDPIQFDTQNNRFAMSVPQDGACFYESGQGFGLSGNAGLGLLGQTDEIFSDRFLGETDLQVRFVNVPEFVQDGELVNYQIEIENLGNAPAQAVGFQELYPRNPAFYPNGQLGAGSFQCQAFGGASCADAAPNIGVVSIRGQSISIPSGGLIRFNVFRLVFGGPTVGGTIDLHAGAVHRTTFGDPNWDSATASMTVVGEGQSIVGSQVNAKNDPILPAELPVADGSDQARIRIVALDDLKNPTPGVSIQVNAADGLSISPPSGTTGADGSVTFFAVTSGAEQAGLFQPVFSAPDLGTPDGLATVDVEFVAGAPDQFSAATALDNVIANGSNSGLIEVTVLDALSNPVGNAEVTVQNNDGLVFTAPSVVTDEFGVASFTMTSTTTGTYSPVFAQAGIIGTASSDITFVSGAAESLVFVVQPSNVTEGAAIDPAVVIHVVDAFGNLVVGDNSSTVTTQLRQNGVGQSFYPDVIAINGVVTLSNLVVATPGTGYDLRLFSNYPIIVSDTFEVLPEPQN